MKLSPASGTLVLLGLAVSLTANLSSQSQAPAASAENPTKQAAHSKDMSAGKRKIPCKTPENALLCYWTHGRLAAGNGNPTFRIWRIGTHRMLGVFNGPSPRPQSSLDEENPEFPMSLNKAYNAYDRRMKQELGYISAVPPPAYADFEVCPLEPERAGWMQPVCIESANNIVIPIDY